MLDAAPGHHHLKEGNDALTHRMGRLLPAVAAIAALTVGCTSGSPAAGQTTPATPTSAATAASAAAPASAATAERALALPSGKHPVAFWPAYHRTSSPTGSTPPVRRSARPGSSGAAISTAPSTRLP